MRFFCSLSLLLLVACGGGGGAGQPAEGGFVVTAARAQVQVTVDGFILVQAQVNGVSGTFILDTGADTFVVTPSLAARAGLRQSGTINISTIAGMSQTRLRRINEFAFGSVLGTEIDAAEIDLVGVDGILGIPLFRAVVVAVDYQREIVELIDPAGFSLSDEARAVGGTIVAAPELILPSINVNGTAVGPLRIDTGSTGGIRLSEALARGLLDTQTETAVVTSTTSNGSVEGDAFIADNVSFASFELEDQFVVVQQPDLIFGLLGGLVLQQFYVVFDLNSGQVLFRKDRELRFALARELRGEPAIFYPREVATTWDFADGLPLSELTSDSALY